MTKKSQEGVTLIVVLLFLMLITLVGIIAVKRSTTDLRVATADQIDTVLLNSSDSANKRIEKVFDDSADQDYLDAMQGNGMFGYYLSELGRSNRDDQYIFCYNPRLDGFAKLDYASIVKPNGNKVMTSGEGYCDISKTDSYSSARSNSLTQVNITRPSAVTVGQGNFKSVTQGSGINVDDPSNESAVFSIRSTSILPSLSSASKEKINACLKKPIAPTPNP